MIVFLAISPLLPFYWGGHDPGLRFIVQQFLAGMHKRLWLIC